MELNLVVDKVVHGKIYPSLAQHQAEPYTPQWRQFNQHWPNTIPLRLQEYCEGHGITLHLYTNTDNYPATSFYPIALGWFNFGIDYFELLPADIFMAVQTGRLRILFYYHEGDNPARITQRLDKLITKWAMPTDCYTVVSSNSAADYVDNCVAFQDSELWYWHRNETPALPVHNSPRSHEFTALVRLHKWWRAAVMSDLKQHGVLDHSYWSYCEGETGHDTIDDCPIELDSVTGLRDNVQTFMQHAPYFADDLDQNQRNDHSVNVDHFFTDAYCNIVLETMFDYDQSGGVLLSEKTFKPIKHGQLFFIAGAAGSLQVLRDLGYRTFDNVLDNSYDLEQNNTQRWILLRDAIIKAKTQGIDRLFEQCLPDIIHNQHLFVAPKTQRLNILLEKLNDKQN